MTFGRPLELDPDRLFPAEPRTRAIARELYREVSALPIISPHGHTDPQWFGDNAAFPDPASLLVIPDHYVFRMLYSQGVPLETLGVPRRDGGPVEKDSRRIWRTFARNYHLFRGAPTQLWHDWVYREVFGIEVRLSEDTADHYFDAISARLADPGFRPRALLDHFRIEVIATTEHPLDPLDHHRKLIDDGWGKRVITTFRPDNVLDPEHEGFAANIAVLGDITREDTFTYRGYLAALMNRRAWFRQHGATASDHGHPTARTADLSAIEAERLFQGALRGRLTPEEADVWRGHMLVEMARMSLEDGLVLQLHAGSWRNHSPQLFSTFGRDKGADIPRPTDYVGALKPLLDRYGSEPSLTVILFTLDETVYARELAPLAGVYPCLRLGPSWWFHDSPEGMMRFREQTTETAGFYNTVGFNDDTRAFLSIPARHDVARRVDCAFLARLVAEGRLQTEDAADLAHDLAYRLAKSAYRL